MNCAERLGERVEAAISQTFSRKESKDLSERSRMLGAFTTSVRGTHESNKLISRTTTYQYHDKLAALHISMNTRLSYIRRSGRLCNSQKVV